MDDTGAASPGHEAARRPVRPSKRGWLLTTSVIGSYSVPEWMGGFKTDYHRGRVSAAVLQEIHEMAIKSALTDQALAGLDIVSDGEFRRDNDMDYLVERLPGVLIPSRQKEWYFDYYDAALASSLAPSSDWGGFGLIDELEFARLSTDSPVTISIAGPFSLSRRLAHASEETDAGVVHALAELLGEAASALDAAGATHLQIDEPFLAGYPEQIELAIASLNEVTTRVEAHVALHVCYGNRYARPAWEGHYDFLFPAVLDAQVDELVLEFARKGPEDLDLFRRFPNDFELGCGVIDVKSRDVESPEVVAARIREALNFVPPQRLIVNPDCGLRHLPPAVARAKLTSMVAGAALVRAEILGGPRPGPAGAGGAQPVDGRPGR